MNRPRIFRALRITWTAFWGIAALSAAVLWIRSDSVRDEISGVGTGRSVRLYSDYGFLGLDGYPDLTSLWKRNDWALDAGVPRNKEYSHWTLAYSYWHNGVSGTDCFVPTWMVVLLFSVVATISWIRFHWFRRFSLRTLLITTTLIGVVLGTIVWLTR